MIYISLQIWGASQFIHYIALQLIPRQVYPVLLPLLLSSLLLPLLLSSLNRFWAAISHIFGFRWGFIELWLRQERQHLGPQWALSAAVQAPAPLQPEAPLQPNNIWGLLWYINTIFFIGDWMLWRNRASGGGGADRSAARRVWAGPARPDLGRVTPGCPPRHVQSCTEGGRAGSGRWNQWSMFRKVRRIHCWLKLSIRIYPN